MVEAAGVAQNGELAERSHLAKRGADNSTSASEENWTRSQRIRTAALLPIDLLVRDAAQLPAYQVIAQQAVHLHRLGMSYSRIAVILHVTDKTVRRAIHWITNLDLATTQK